MNEWNHQNEFEQIDVNEEMNKTRNKSNFQNCIFCLVLLEEIKLKINLKKKRFELIGPNLFYFFSMYLVLSFSIFDLRFCCCTKRDCLVRHRRWNEWARREFLSVDKIGSIEVRLKMRKKRNENRQNVKERAIEFDDITFNKMMAEICHFYLDIRCRLSDVDDSLIHSRETQ